MRVCYRGGEEGEIDLKYIYIYLPIRVYDVHMDILITRYRIGDSDFLTSQCHWRSYTR